MHIFEVKLSENVKPDVVSPTENSIWPPQTRHSYISCSGQGRFLIPVAIPMFKKSVFLVLLNRML
jgi:hypothetical protein